MILKCVRWSFHRGFSSLSAPRVFVSESTDVFRNLALEDWFYRRMANDPRAKIMLWRNEGCVVIGRHQNPWLEARLGRLEREGVRLARRNSGGGAVFHDLGNLNCTFFTTKDSYSRKRNLELLCQALKARWELDVSVSPREDILLDGKYKISGTAAKLGRVEAYHHCTVLFNADRRVLSKVLRNPSTPLQGVVSKSTRSVSSPVKNLCENRTDIHFDSLIEAIVQKIRHQYQIQDCLVEMVDPNEEQFPGIEELRENLECWDWKFGKCPAFTLTKDEKSMKVNRGVIEECFGFSNDLKGLKFPHSVSQSNSDWELHLINEFPELFQ